MAVLRLDASVGKEIVVCYVWIKGRGAVRSGFVVSRSLKCANMSYRIFDGEEKAVEMVNGEGGY
jgi:hypothetical protein